MAARNLESPGTISRWAIYLQAASMAAGLFVTFPLTDASATEGGAGRRTALVIGNTQYSSFPVLPGAVTDANRIATALDHANFEVSLSSNLDKRQLEDAIRKFLRGLSKRDVALFYYGGHAIQVGGNNYLVPVDAKLSSRYDLEVETYNLSSLLAYMSASSSVQIAILDASSSNPHQDKEFNVGKEKTAARSQTGLAALEPERDSLIVYSTSPGQISVMQQSADNPFAAALSTHALDPNVEIRKIVALVREEVAGKTNGKQVPWDASHLDSDFYLYQRQNLVIVETVREVRASPSATTVELGMHPPITSGDEGLLVSFDSLPVHGDLWLGEQKIAYNTKVSADDLPRVVLRRSAGGDTKEFIDYTARGAAGQTASGSFSIVFDAPEDQPVVPNLVISDVPEDESRAEELSAPAPIRISMGSEIGTGFVSISDADTSIDPIAGWLRLKSRDSDAQVAVGNVLIAPGDLISPESIKDVKIRPSLDAVGEEVAVVIEPASSREPAPSIAINVAVSVNRCDELAGEPLDVQGVTDGLLPNEIDIPAAKEACREAIAANPGVPRFRYEYGRALYAAGEFEAALSEFQAAYDAGHVRAGMKIARLYQLGAGVARNPERAIPLLQAGAEKGDPYAQNTLAKALIEGEGVARDISRGIELYAEAAESGHTFAMNALGAEYLYGRNVTKDEPRALRFFEASVGRNDVWGLVNLGLMFRDGLVVPKDTSRATELFQKANAGGHPYAATLLGMLARDSRAGSSELLGYFRESARRGDAWGAFFAAELLSDEPRLENEKGEAIRLLALAASQRTPDVSDRAKAALAKAGKRSVRIEIQRTLSRMGVDVGEIDGALGKKSHEGIAAALGAEAPDRSTDILIELIRKEWIDSHPRLDML